MKKIYNSSRGFTLLELLIVITIIGILTTIILNSISSARAKSYDSKVEQQLRGFRTAAEIYFSNQSPNTYGTTNVCSSGIFADVNETDGSPGLYIQTSNLPASTQVACNAADSTYAVEATLYNANQFWCVDSKGTFKFESGTINSTNLCP